MYNPNRRYFKEEDNASWVAKYKLLTLLRKLDVSVEYVLCRKSLVGNGQWLFDLKLK